MVCVVGVSDSILDFQSKGESLNLLRRSKVNNESGLSILQIHHIDGDATNNKEQNLQVLCPNHHAMTEHFGSRNKNSTRKYRYKK